MKNSLRIRFTVTAIVSVLLVLVVMVSAINLMNYNKVVSDSDKVLGMLAENGGSFPEHMKPEPGKDPEPAPPKDARGGRSHPNLPLRPDTSASLSAGTETYCLLIRAISRP